MTKLSLASNKLGEDGTKVICDAVKENKILKELNISGDAIFGNIGGPAGAKHVADMLAVNASLTKLSLGSSSIMDEGVGAVCEAIMSNKDIKIMELNFCNNGITPVGAKPVAAMIAVTASIAGVAKLGKVPLVPQISTTCSHVCRRDKPSQPINSVGSANLALEPTPPRASQRLRTRYASAPPCGRPDLHDC